MVQSLLLLIMTSGAILGSPGPAPLSLAAVGGSFGWRRGFPYLLGLVTAIGAGCAAASLGLGSLIRKDSVLTMLLMAVSSLYILSIAWKVVSASALPETQDRLSVPRFRDGLIVNLTNPKAYAAILAVYAGFALPFESSLPSVLATGAVVIIVAFLVDLVWLAAGALLKGLFEDERYARPLRVSFAVLMVVAVGLSIKAVFSMDV
ncbi:MAG: LysE family translocator [Pseudomonadota bacterium]